MSTQTATPDVEKETQADEETEAAMEPPYRVLIHNDDVTPMDFVIIILEDIFNIQRLAAELIMWAAHVTGVALVTVLPKSEAQQKVGKAHFAASLEGYPLKFTVEPEDS